ncbi:unnamed protein product [Paramecium sonneborni]|uniref:Uncharacterized protein n=1 Tax=Paramecium sonneborni TaxID=65129 RepID=A0A8S1MAY6_9CILI|nr:unnamed protein product [Paramecium sonneborni]
MIKIQNIKFYKYQKISLFKKIQLEYLKVASELKYFLGIKRFQNIFSTSKINLHTKNLQKALTYCLQEETPVSITDIMQIQQNQQITNKQPRIIAQPNKLDSQQFPQKFIKKSSIKEIIHQGHQDLKQAPKITQDFSVYQSEWQKNILNKYYNLNTGNNSFCNKTRRRTYSIQMNSKKVNLRMRDMSMFTERKFQLEPNIEF